jgi:signal peptidase I
VNPQLSRGLSGARQVILTGGAVVGVLCILVAIGAVLFGLRPLVFRSGSMSPTIGTGALAIAHRTDAADLHKGDIVSVPMTSGERVTHRILAMERDGKDAILTLKGDANDTPDLAPYRVSHADRVLFSVPKVGYLVGWLTGPLGLFFLGLYAAFLLSVIVRRPAQPPGDGPDDGLAQKARQPGGRRKATGIRRGPSDRVAHRSRSTLVSAVLLTFVAGGVAQVWALPTLAAWTDAGGVSGTTLTAYRVPQPAVPTSCTVGGTAGARTVTIQWPAVTSPGTTYVVSVSTVVGSVGSVTGTTTKQVIVTYNANTAGNQNKMGTVTITPSLTTTPAWVGTTTRAWRFKTPTGTGAPICEEQVAPTVAIVDPDGTTRSASAMVTYMGGASGCNNANRPACGTLSDTSGVSTLDYILQRTQSSTVRCWTGSAWGTDCTTYVAGTVATSTTWNIAGSNSTVYATPGGSFSLTVRATDLWGNQQTATRAFTVSP